MGEPLSRCVRCGRRGHRPQQHSKHQHQHLLSRPHHHLHLPPLFLPPLSLSKRNASDSQLWPRWVLSAAALRRVDADRQPYRRPASSGLRLHPVRPSSPEPRRIPLASLASSPRGPKRPLLVCARQCSTRGATLPSVVDH